MAKRIKDVMSKTPTAVKPGTDVARVARIMRDENIGAVLVSEGGRIRGLVTDRDLVVRALARGGHPEQLPVSDVCGTDLATVTADDDLGRAVEIMRSKSLRRIPVVDGNGSAVGIVSIGDLAIERDEESALADISAAKPNG